ncbi:peptidoglycan-associated lipoprotein Pal [candidate division CSSED10-310 bacterium]|uniref:Peptidoglycan-associated lipoprotein n=1 Tax=candidate division CSSED10-310 bacterium TaxID=2855610 RepID=A0ABV6YUQ5_UNCC1
MLNKSLNFLGMIFIVVLALAIVLSGCPKRDADKGLEDTKPVTPVPTVVPEPTKSPYAKEIDDATEMRRDRELLAALEDINFEYDKYSLTDEARSVLAKNAVFLKRNLSVRVQIEGHCDERGTTEYNLALGQKRADAARQYLVMMGVNGDRMSTISYGEERPLDSGQDEVAWAKNRRAHFDIISR